MDRDSLLKLIDSEKDAHIAFLQAFVQAPSTNPPGDTRQAAAVISEYLRQKNVPAATMAGKAELPNVVSSFTGAGARPRVAMNGHIDIFAVGDSVGWDHVVGLQ
jgi:acetylornithine deacetylase/succinyl-diaminopimelate desuccinylase-like protein